MPPEGGVVGGVTDRVWGGGQVTGCSEGGVVGGVTDWMWGGGQVTECPLRVG